MFNSSVGIPPPAATTVSSTYFLVAASVSLIGVPRFVITVAFASAPCPKTLAKSCSSVFVSPNIGVRSTPLPPEMLSVLPERLKFCSSVLAPPKIGVRSTPAPPEIFSVLPARLRSCSSVFAKPFKLTVPLKPPPVPVKSRTFPAVKLTADTTPSAPPAATTLSTYSLVAASLLFMGAPRLVITVALASAPCPRTLAKSCSSVLTPPATLSTYVFTAFWVGNKTFDVPRAILSLLFAASSFKAMAASASASFWSTSACTAAIAASASASF